MNLPKIKIRVEFEAGEKLFKITSSKDAEKAFREVFDADTINWTEEFIVLCLNNANEVIGYSKISSGGMTSTIVDARVLFTIALNSAATSIIIAHNHPSGALSPSPADINITNQLVEGGKLLNIKLIDHIIISRNGYYSFLDEGQI